MGRKRGKKENKCINESQQIRTRLIAISIRMDDYIYNKIPISLHEAQSYVQEVTSYKLQCLQDERSLQVIEKLVRCMKAIVTEHQETRLEDCDMNDAGPHGDNGSDSPVYSLPDEDRTQITPALVETSPYHIINRRPKFQQHNTKETKLTHVVDEDDAMRKTINLCSDNEDDCTFIDAENIELNVDIQKGLSKLSLNNLEPDITIPSDMECSQSILNNFYEENGLLNKDKSTQKSTNIEFVGKDGKGIEENVQKNQPITKLFIANAANATKIQDSTSNTSRQNNKQSILVKKAREATTTNIQRNTQRIIENKDSKHNENEVPEIATKPIATTTVQRNISKPIHTKPIEESSSDKNVVGYAKTKPTTVQESTQKPTKDTILKSKTIESTSQDQTSGVATSAGVVNPSMATRAFINLQTKKKIEVVAIPTSSNKRSYNKRNYTPVTHNKKRNTGTNVTSTNKQKSLIQKTVQEATNVQKRTGPPGMINMRNNVANTITKMNRLFHSPSMASIANNFFCEHYLSWLDNIIFVRDIDEDEYFNDSVPLNEHDVSFEFI